MSSPTTQVAIIGAGLSGLTLALALRQQNISCILYEGREASLDIGGAIMLSPNALKVLDALGVYEKISPLGYHFEDLHFHSDDDKPVDAFQFGSAAKHGYRALRIYRFELINVLVSMVRDAGIPVEYNKKFTRVVSEREDAVTWEFEDGSTASANLLVGADGIHSRVRRHLYPDLAPKFTNMIGVTAAVPTEQLGADKDYPLPVTLMSPKHGAFVIAPQRADGSEVLIGRQCRLQQEYDRQGWNDLISNKSCNSVSDIPLKGINLWPFYLVPKLDTWVSQPHARVLILGDAAHAIPPTAGQGVNQAFEDVYTFAGVYSRVQQLPNDAQSKALRNWQLGRQDRVDRVLDLNEQLNKRRLPENVKKGVFEPFDLDWLYGADFDKLVGEWASV
ncbi:6-hydroxynicotinate 3-monooxygenase [Cladobotryum mycophilum]|uniref:6-hydroxynicotinate 3-monooxygenase n=1 Tax=Cladobotryum mycophilum TaxID=491253 RepID=A0ABR0SB08_9HYPO